MVDLETSGAPRGVQFGRVGENYHHRHWWFSYLFSSCVPTSAVPYSTGTPTRVAPQAPLEPCRTADRARHHRSPLHGAVPTGAPTLLLPPHPTPAVALRSPARPVAARHSPCRHTPVQLSPGPYPSMAVRRCHAHPPQGRKAREKKKPMHFFLLTRGFECQ